jgi:hypothetical protein
MSHIEKRIILDEATERVLKYTGESDQSRVVGSGLLEVRDVHRLIDGVAYANRVYTLTGMPLDDLNIQMEFESDQPALTTQLRKFELAMTWKFQADRAAGPRLALDGTYTYWSLG